MSVLGAILRAGSEIVGAGELAAIADAGATLGPGGGRLETRANVGLCHRRSSRQPAQPVGDGRHLLVADARLDNRRELARSLGLKAAGPAGDAELLLAAYRAWGEGCAARLVGDFAFVLWDRHRRRLLCGRDALGVRPLHYARAGSMLVVASEAQQIVAHPAVPRALDRETLAAYLLSRRPPPGRTVFERVGAVPPGHLLVAGEAGQRLVRYWSPQAVEPAARATDPEEIRRRFREAFTRAVADRLEEGGAACGVMLSGGLDSSSVAVAAAEALRGERSGGRLALYNGSFRAFADCDEGFWVDAVAARLGLTVERIPVQPGWLSPAAVAGESPESPFAGWQGLWLRVLRRLSLRGGRVLLTGHGGDAVAGGSALVYADRLRHGELGVLREIREHAAATGSGAIALLGHWALEPLAPRAVRHALDRGRASSAVPDWLDPTLARRVADDERRRARPAPARPESLARAALRAQVERLDGVLRVVHWSRRLAAGYGVDVRHPFLDRRLVEMVLATPPRMLFRAGRYKELLRGALGGLLPPEVRDRPSKTSFGSYLDACWRGDGGREIEELLRAPRLAELGLVRAGRLRQAFSDYRQGRTSSFRGQLWAIITLEAWLGRHAARGRPRKPRTADLTVVRRPGVQQDS